MVSSKSHKDKFIPNYFETIKITFIQLYRIKLMYL